MPLVYCKDLLTETPEAIAHYTAWASDLLDMYEEFIRKDEEDVAFVAGWHGSKNRSGGVHASELSGECKRAVWYSIKGTVRQDSNLDPFWKKRFRVGHMLHGMTQEDWRRLAAKSNGLIQFDSEVKIHPSLQTIAKKYNVHSSCDGVVAFREDPWGPVVLRVGLEIKTESGDQFKELKGPKEQHKRQTCVYQRCLDVPLMWTMYINKSNQNIVPSKYPYLFQFDFSLWNSIEKELQEVYEMAKSEDPPERVESLSCQFCGYSWVCEPDCMKKKRAKESSQKERAQHLVTLRKSSTGGVRVPKTGAL